MSTQVPANKADTHVFAYNGMRGEDIKFTLSQLRQMLPGVSKATDAELFVFVEMCIAHKLNPYLREAYLVKYSATEPAQMVVGKETFTQRAEMNPDFDGYKPQRIFEWPIYVEDSASHDDTKGSPLPRAA